MRGRLQYQLDKVMTRLGLTIGRRMPRWLAYWAVIDAGTRYMKPDEVVPDVPLVTVLSRMPKW